MTRRVDLNVDLGEDRARFIVFRNDREMAAYELAPAGE